MVIVNFMRRFIEHENDNKMNKYNICLMFAPNILTDGNQDPATTFTYTSLHISNMMVLVDRFETVFGQWMHLLAPFKPAAHRQ